MAGLVVAGSMLADIADGHELVTSRRQAGVFFAAQAFAVKASSALGTFPAGVGLDLIAFRAKTITLAVAASGAR